MCHWLPGNSIELGTRLLSGFVSKIWSRGLSKYELKYFVKNIENVWMSLKVTSKFIGITLNRECFYLVIQVRSTDMNNLFGLTQICLTWDSKRTFTQSLFWSHGRAGYFKNMIWIQDLPNPCWFVPCIYKEEQGEVCTGWTKRGNFKKFLKLLKQFIDKSKIIGF